MREFPGQVLIPPPKDDKAVTTEGDKGKEKEVEEPAAVAQEGEQPSRDEEQLADKVAALKVDGEEEKAQANGVAEEPAAETLPPPVPAAATDGSDGPVSEPVASTSAAAEEAQPARTGEANDDDDDDDDDDVSDAESDSSAGSWITPDNVHAHKVRDLGLFEAPEASTSAAASATASTSSSAAAGAPTTTAGNTAKAAKTPKPKTIMKAAVLTGDYAMQNVALQMGLNVLGSGGKRVREVRTWVLRCHACFK